MSQSRRHQSSHLFVSFSNHNLVRHARSLRRSAACVKSNLLTVREWSNAVWTMLLFVAAAVAQAVVADRAAVLSRAFRSSMGKCGMSLKEAAGHYGADVAQLSRELQGIGHLSLTRIAHMPTPFCQWFALDLVSSFGLPDEVRTAQMIAECVL